MQELPLYIGADRGHFKVVRLTDQAGLHLNANCRIREATVFNYLSDLRYAIIGYVIEYWEDGAPAPHEEGVATSFIPRNRPNIQRLYMRAKPSVTRKMLYLEDAIINDFLNTKVLADSMSLLTYTQESAEQVASAAMWRVLGKSKLSYQNAVHITKFEATSSTPLTLTQQGLRFDWKVNGVEQPQSAQVDNLPFTKLRDMYPAMQSFLEGLENGSN